jgi:hypothetical protein
MSKYKDNFDKLANSIYDKIMEAAQQGQVPQTPQQPAAQPQVDPTAGAVAGQAEAGAAMPADAGAAGAVDPTAAGDVGVEDPSMQTGMEGEEETDEVGMSEIQEMAGELAQMLRDFKESNPDEYIEAAKFAAGMVVSAAISGLKYKDRKDILKKVKAGEFNQEGGEEQAEEEAPMEQQPGGQEGMVAERLRKEDSRNDDDKRKGLNPIEKRKKKSPKSPFSGVNEEDENHVNATVPVTASTSDLAQIANNASGKTVTFRPEGVSDPSSAITQTAGNNISKVSDALKNKNSSTFQQNTNGIAESVRVTKRQLDMIRLSETKTKYVKFSKKQLEEIMKK